MQPVYYIMPPSVFFLFNPIPQKTPNGGKLVFLVTCPSFRTPVCSDKADASGRIMFSTVQNGHPENTRHKKYTEIPKNDFLVSI
ncbi:hypothetical protein B5M57_03255 [Bacillus velezensis]|nr:hypothetical protein U722_05685 [Bacillus amyloliquefaciens LFB112]OQV45006.1 hypothetical protein B5M57_03255 [Bacillus velezensis]